MYSGLGNAINSMLYVGVIGIACLILLGGYNLVDYFFLDEKYETKTIVVPEKKLTTDGQKVDTVYVYTFK